MQIALLGNWKSLSSEYLKELFKKPVIKQFIKINEFDETFWFNKEAFSDFIYDLHLIVQYRSNDKKSDLKFIEKLKKMYSVSDWKIEVLLNNLK